MPPVDEPSRINLHFNRSAAIIGYTLFIAAFVILAMPSLTSQIGVTFPVLVACVGLGLLLYAVGDEAKIFSKGLTITGAGAIALTLFITWNKVSQESEYKFKGLLHIIASNPRNTVEMMKSDGEKFKPTKATISYVNQFVSGTLNKEPDGYSFDFSLNAKDAIRLKDVDCPVLHIEFANGDQFFKKFGKEKMMPADYDAFFKLDYVVDLQKIYYLKEQNSFLVKDCADREIADVNIAKEMAKAETNITVKPDSAFAKAPVPQASVKIAPAMEPLGTATPAQPAATVEKSQPEEKTLTTGTQDLSISNRLLGYTVFARFDPEAKSVAMSWYNIEGKPDARFPVPGDIIEATKNISVRLEPFHWDGAKHVQSSSIAHLKPGDKAVVSADVIIAGDESSGQQYAIAPISKVLGMTLPEAAAKFPPPELPPYLQGYAYIGYLGTDGTFADRTFTNYTKPDAIYPSPNDILVASVNVWLRAGPRRWDADKGGYISAPSIKAIRAGQYVRVGGDTVLAKGGLSIWTPISHVYENGLDEIIKEAKK